MACVRRSGAGSLTFCSWEAKGRGESGQPARRSLGAGGWRAANGAGSTLPAKGLAVVITQVVDFHHGLGYFHLRFAAVLESPVKPGQTRSNPVQPGQTQSNPVKPSPTQSNPVKPSQTQSSPVKPGQTQSNLVKPSQTWSNPVKPGQTQSSPVQPSQTRSNPVKPSPTQSNPVQPAKPENPSQFSCTLGRALASFPP
jgi:hypothetical protein